MFSILSRSCTFPESRKAKDDPNSEHIALLPAQTILAQMKDMNLSQRIYALIAGATAEGYSSPPEAQKRSMDGLLIPSNPKRKAHSPSIFSRSSSARSLSRKSFSYRSVDRNGDSELDTEEQYSNSNISSSFPMDDYDHEECVDSPPKEKARRSNLGRGARDYIPEGHLVVYVGIRKRRFVITTQVVTHSLFKQLLQSEYYHVDDKDGTSSIVLTCDTGYFQRLLFLIDRDGMDMESRYEVIIG